MNLAAKSFDLTNARECAVLADAAYSFDLAHLPGVVISHAFISKPETDTQVLVIEFTDYIAVFFRGTSDLRDALTDCKILRVKFLKGEIHSGGYRALESVTVELRDAILAMPRNKPLVIGGHSLGGLLAGPFAYEWEMELRSHSNPQQPIFAVYTFGKPRVFDQAAQYAYNAALYSRTFRIVNAGDPVPLMPGLLSGYLHEGQEIFIRPSSDGWHSDLKVSPSRLWEIFWDARDIRHRVQTGDFSFLEAAEHRITFYQSQLDHVVA